MAAAAAAFMPPPPEFAEPPPLWGKEDHVRDMFDSAATGFEFGGTSTGQEADSLESFAGLFMDKFPMMASARAMLGDRFGELRQATLDVWREWNEAEDGSFRPPQEYLLSIVRL